MTIVKGGNKKMVANQDKKDLIAKLTERVTSSCDFKTFADTKEIYWYDNKLGTYTAVMGNRSSKH
ncbi:MAG: hypothetical protein WBX01_08325 [Nitrososphaeraceae archaeon]|jgi:hypothetical protein